jgi:dihydrofolate reductase
LTLRYSLEDALAPFRNTDEEVFVIGGAELFKEAMGQMDRFYLTVIDRNFEGDVCLPQFDLNKFDLTSEIKNKNEDFEYYFRDYQRNLSI